VKNNFYDLLKIVAIMKNKSTGRFMKNKKIDWSNHLVELLVVFIGISLAFMLNNWRENRSDQIMAEKYINSFRNDIEYDFAQLDSIISRDEKKLDRFIQLIKSLKDNSATISDAERIIGDMATLNPFMPKISTYESIKNSGHLNLLTDYNIRERLIQYYQSLEDKKLVEEMNMLYMNNYIIPFIHENADFMKGKIINRNIIKNHNFTNLVLGYYQLLLQQVDAYKNLSELNKELKLLLVIK